MCEKVLTANQVKDLPAGQLVYRHSYDRYGYPVTARCFVVQTGPKGAKALDAILGGAAHRFPIRKETERLYYTIKEA